MTHKKRASDSKQVVHLLEMPNGGASDIALKTEVTEITSAVKRLIALRPVTWRWKRSTSNQSLQYGFIAQEVEKIFPELVSEKRRGDGTEYKYLSSKSLLPYLVRALIEQQQQIDTLQRRIDSHKDTRG